MADKCTTESIIAGNTIILLARVIASDGTAIQQADVDSISVYYEDTEDDDDTGTTLSLVVANTVYDTLQTAAKWTDKVDSTGYNFEWVMSGTHFTTYNTTYYVEVTMNEINAGPVKVAWYVRTHGK